MNPLRRALIATVDSRPAQAVALHVVPELHVPYWMCCGQDRDVIEAMERLIAIGDGILTESPWGVPSLVTPGLDHALRVIQAGSCVVCGHMTKNHFNRITLDTLAQTTRRIVAFRRVLFDLHDATQAANCTKAIKDQPKKRDYDTTHTRADSRLDCVELLYHTAPRYERQYIKFGKAFGTGRALLLPRHFLKAKDKDGNPIYKVVFDTKGKLGPKPTEVDQ